MASWRPSKVRENTVKIVLFAEHLADFESVADKHQHSESYYASSALPVSASVFETLHPLAVPTPALPLAALSVAADFPVVAPGLDLAGTEAGAQTHR